MSVSPFKSLLKILIQTNLCFSIFHCFHDFKDLQTCHFILYATFFNLIFSFLEVLNKKQAWLIMSIMSDEVNFLVYRYLQESGMVCISNWSLSSVSGISGFFNHFLPPFDSSKRLNSDWISETQLLKICIFHWFLNDITKKVFSAVSRDSFT